MTDLDAPLGQQGGQQPPRKPVDRDKSEKSGGGRGNGRMFPKAVIAAACISIVALNAYALAVKDVAPRTATIALAAAPEEPPTSDAGTIEKAEPATDGVKVLYGTQASANPAPAQPPMPEPRPDPEDGLISEGGPKIITVRDPSAASVGQPLQVAHIPDQAALEASQFGDLPIIASDGQRPMDIYARPWSRAGGKRIAVVIGGLGLSQTGTNRALEKLPPEITLAFAPQGNSLNRWMEMARKEGHELLVQVPMEPFGYPQNDPGPQTLTVAASEDENLDNLHYALGRLTNYTGIVNYQGGRLMADTAAMAPIMEDLSRRGILYLSDGTAGGQALAQLARQKGVPYLSGQSVIDTTQDPKAIRARLEELEQIASARGYAIGTGSALETTVDVVANWANEAKKNGFEIVGVSALAR